MDGSGLDLMSSSLLSLSVLFGLLLGAVFLRRRLRATSWGRGRAAQSPIRIVASRALGGQNMLVIAEVEEQRFLLAVSRSGIANISQVGGHE